MTGKGTSILELHRPELICIQPFSDLTFLWPDGPSPALESRVPILGQLGMRQMNSPENKRSLQEVLASTQLPALPSSAIKILELAQNPTTVHLPTPNRD